MNTSIRNSRQEKGMSLQQFADLMGVDKLEALSMEADDISGILDRETKRKADAIFNDPTVVIEPIDIEDSAINASLWTLGATGHLDNEDVKQELLNRINAGTL
jgi:transcriptional regulator with XRE-family HTH domain